MVNQRPTLKLLSVKSETPGGRPCRRVTFELWPEKDPYSVFVGVDVADEEIVRVARQQLADEFSALAKAMGS